MSTTQESNKALVQKLLAELDAGNRDIVREVYSPDLVMHFAGSPPMGMDDLVAMVDTVYTAFPDFMHRIEDMFADGDKVIVRLTDVGTHQGEYEGVPPTGKEISFGAIAIMEIRDGMVVELWEEIDMLGFMQQLGLELKPGT